MKDNIRNNELEGKEYDVFPYPGKAFTQTHPAVLSAVASLFNIDSQKLNGARVLELGTADGGNLFPLAIFYPNTEFVGIDYSRVQIEKAQEIQDKIGIKNIQFLHKNILDIDISLGKFDYIICHGVFSWVPQEVQQGILRCISELLTDKGLAFISYNTYPGWKICEIARDMMLYNVRNIPQDDARTRLTLAKNMINFVDKFNEDRQDQELPKLLHKEFDYLNKSNEYWLLHEHLETFNQPMYFKDFYNLLGKYQLSYLSDVNIGVSYLPTLTDEQRQMLLEASSHKQSEMEQYYDFLTCRRFRQSIITKSDNIESYDANLSIDLKNKNYLFYFGLEEHFEKNRNTTNNTKYYICNGDEHNVISCSNEIEKYFLDYLVKNNIFCVLETQDMINHVKEILPDESEESIYIIGNNLFSLLLLNKRLQLFSESPQFNYVEEISDKPKLHDSIRLYAKNKNVLCHPIHVQSTLTDLEALIIRYFDGHHTIEQIIEEIQKLIKAEEITLTNNDQSVEDPKEASILLKGIIDNSLQTLLRLRLLVA